MPLFPGQDEIFLGRGGQGVDPNSQMAEDIRGLSDVARRKTQGPTPGEQQAAFAGLAKLFGQMPGFERIAAQFQAGEGAPQQVEERSAAQPALGLSPSQIGQMGRLEQTQVPAMEQNISQNLKTAFGEGQNPIQSLVGRMAENVFSRTLEGQGEDADQTKVMAELTKQITNLRKRSQAVLKSGTGNTLAKSIYSKVAEELVRMVSQLQDKGIAELAVPASTPDSGE